MSGFGVGVAVVGVGRSSRHCGFLMLGRREVWDVWLGGMKSSEGGSSHFGGYGWVPWWVRYALACYYVMMGNGDVDGIT